MRCLCGTRAAICVRCRASESEAHLTLNYRSRSDHHGAELNLSLVYGNPNIPTYSRLWSVDYFNSWIRRIFQFLIKFGRSEGGEALMPAFCSKPSELNISFDDRVGRQLKVWWNILILLFSCTILDHKLVVLDTKTHARRARRTSRPWWSAP